MKAYQFMGSRGAFLRQPEFNLIYLLLISIISNYKFCSPVDFLTLTFVVQVRRDRSGSATAHV